jgi:hypothetical protein
LSSARAGLAVKVVTASARIPRMGVVRIRGA